MNKNLASITVIILFLISSISLKIKLDMSPIDPFESEEEFLKFSDIAGSDLYAEQINAYVAGDKSIIRQSLFSNDTNIFSQFDTNDPAFFKCNVLISASNGIQPEIFPKIMTESNIPDQYIPGFNRFVGFLYYDDEVDGEDANMRAERALEIIKRKFQIDLFLVNSSEQNFFPFVGDCPNWEILFKELTTKRLISPEYLSYHHLSSTLMIINSLDFFEGEFEVASTQLDFNIDSLDLTYLQNLETEDLITQFSAIIENFGDILNTTISEDEFEQFIEVAGTFTLSNDSHYTSLLFQYEGIDEGITQTGKNQFKFDLWDAMGYVGEPLAPSEKIYIALIGAFMTDIEINVLCTDIIDATPLNYEFYDFLLEQIGLLLYLAGIEFDIESIEDYSFELFWVNEEGFKRSYVKPVNLNDPSDIINLLQQLGFQGFSYIPTGILNPIDDFMVTYNISKTEPNLLLRKELLNGNASFGVYRNFTYQIIAENVGNTTAWGVPTPIPLNLNDFFLLLTLGNQLLADEVQNTIWDIVQIEYSGQYESLEDFFNFDDDPLIFSFDSFGTGIYDTYFPNLLNFTNLWPYNNDMDNVIDIIISGYPQLITALAALGQSPSELKDIFTNSDSIWNSNNWKLEPGMNISYQLDNISISNLDSFSPFYRNNFTIDTENTSPEIISGISINGTIPEHALESDEQNWIIESVEKFLTQKIEIDFIFRNESKFDLNLNPLERVSLIINFSTSDALESLDFEIFNFQEEQFQVMDQYLDSIVNNTWTFHFINNNQSLDWLFYPIERENHTMLFKITCTNPDKFNISIDDLDVEFTTRDININDDPGSRVAFGSKSGNVQFERRSNSIPLSTFDMASIIATSHLSNYSSMEGNINTYTLTVENSGSNIAENITISLLIPGIVQDPNDFLLENSNLSYYLSKLAPQEEKSINFTFYVPNTRKISRVSIKYNNPEFIQGGNSSTITTTTNDVYISAPVDYINRYPFVRIIEIDSIVNSALVNGPTFNITYFLKNRNPTGIVTKDIRINIDEQMGDLIRIDNTDLFFENIFYNETISWNMTMRKIDWKSYYYPPINFFESSEGLSIQIFDSTPTILGTINFTLKKYVDKEQIEIGEVITVYIEVKNEGTINVSDILINDIIGYSPSQFSLVDGNLVHLIADLEPGETVSFNYKIKAKRQGLATLNPAYLSFYYLQKMEETSDNVIVKINTPFKRQILYLIVPGMLGIVILVVYMNQIKNYKARKKELARRERHFFKLDSQDSILKSDHTLQERLSFLSNPEGEFEN
ncbi:MAG: hypothetical protein ACXADU_05880 [Promethearchaeota archaeon]|jgi:uncharacterized repeat protein (TIGR01451 family)